jgi:hypothetical protein
VGHPWLLRHLTKAVEAAKLPPHEQSSVVSALDAQIKDCPGMLRERVIKLGSVSDAGHRHLAMFRCAATGLAAERYRLDKGRWPEKLGDLVPAYLPAVPLDPYDGKPLRLARKPDGVVVYALGRDGRDDGGDFETLNTHQPGTDYGFRLWDVDKRRQPPK